MRRREESYHGDVANFDWPGAESLGQSVPREWKCGPCFPVKSREKKDFLKKKKKKGGEDHPVKTTKWV